ncbi:hypothetical protein OIE52_28725 [Streptomyces canus]|nr:hypothetical protein [Streptomyces canus]
MTTSRGEQATTGAAPPMQMPIPVRASGGRPPEEEVAVVHECRADRVAPD